MLTRETFMITFFKQFRQMAGETVEPLLLFVSGVGGTGKSFLIDCLRDSVRLLVGVGKNDVYCDPVAVAAPTGIAAYNINGSTIHRFFKLPVQHGKDDEYWKLSPSDRKLFRTVWNSLKLIIIDKISMVSDISLAKIHLRLNEVIHDESSECFAGKNIVLFGDLLQFPPVSAGFCFEQYSNQTARTVFCSVRNYLLWQQFKYKELTINMRQRDDLTFAEMLSHVRAGNPTNDDLEQLKSCVVPTEISQMKDVVRYFCDNIAQDEDSSRAKGICLLGTNEEVDLFNRTMLEKLKINFEKIIAVDTGKDGRRLSKRSEKIRKVSDTAGLEDVLLIGIGARVMLRRNQNVEKGLVNGSLGTVVNVYRKADKVTKIDIHFDNQQSPTSIERVVAEYEISKNIIAVRSQFPLCLAYAITIHKSQSLTLEILLTDMNDLKIFQAGMVYTALSCGKRLDGIHLISFSPYSIDCSEKAFEEYRRLTLANDTSNDGNVNQSVYLQQCNQLAAPYDKKPKLRKEFRFIANVLEQSVVPKSSKLVNVETKQVYFLKFKNNDGTLCYSNVIAQSLIRLELLFTNGASNEILDVLKNFRTLHLQKSLVTAVTDTLRLLASDVKNDYTLCQQRDAAEFFEHVIQQFPDEKKQLFGLTVQYIRTCSVCNNRRDSVPEIVHIVQLNAELNPRDPVCKFKDLGISVQ